MSVSELMLTLNAHPLLGVLIAAICTITLVGTVMFWVDYRTPVDALRAEVKRICEAAPEWDGRFQNLQVTDTSEQAMQVRVLVTSVDAGKNWDLRCRIREELLKFIQTSLPDCLPRTRATLMNFDRSLTSDGSSVNANPAH